MNQFMSNLVCEGFSSCSTEICHENAEMQKRKFDDVTLQLSIGVVGKVQKLPKKEVREGGEKSALSAPNGGWGLNPGPTAC